MTQMNFTYVIACNASSTGAIFIDSPPIVPPTYLQGVAIVIYTILSIVTVGGNALVYLTVFHYMGIATGTNLFIANLAVTDFFIGLVCIPIVLISDYLLSDWPFGIFMCKFTSFAQSVFVVCTVYTLIAMSVDRYVAIIYPLHAKLTRKQCYVLIAALWAFSIVFSFPIYFEMHIVRICFHRDFEDTKEYSQTVCQTNGLSTSIQTIYNIMTLTIIYLLPLIILSIVYLRLGWQLNRSQAPGEAHSRRDAKIKKSKRKVIKMCSIVVIMFGVCWFPMQLYTNILHPYLNRIFDQKYMPHFYFAFHLMAMSNSCVNPFIYGIMSSKFRAGFLHYWHCLTSSYGSVTDHFRPIRSANESIVLTVSLQGTQGAYKANAANHQPAEDSQINRACSRSMIPLMRSNKSSAYD
ncbi:unnamed protein product [Rotaria socialis]|uniref:G-protein coupled receptors family 1 profile domain-containing protein n=2 Tax=Rotaria socialis TaxID=392032 RepID=A0A820XT88_9BILA|nr:unnamed protein product [Rotaria socialis]CAF3705277.1 unnamed protein product [Rotaria socialis]CAF4500956.1 unnamed protein product [Rotaria socialis]CAF4537155.1 unnamed protein product [Rotaria socialis]CAF4641591.1 unnamed protein product [Rotaria socialis]